MKYILVASKDQKACSAIQSCFHAGYRVDIASDKSSCFEMFRQRRYECLFIDIDFLHDPDASDDYKKQLQPFWSEFPEAEIIVLSRPELIRETIHAVKAGASDYLTYPVDPTEVKLVVENIKKVQ